MQHLLALGPYWVFVWKIHATIHKDGDDSQQRSSAVRDSTGKRWKNPRSSLQEMPLFIFFPSQINELALVFFTPHLTVCIFLHFSSCWRKWSTIVQAIIACRISPFGTELYHWFSPKKYSSCVAYIMGRSTWYKNNVAMSSSPGLCQLILMRALEVFQMQSSMWEGWLWEGTLDLVQGRNVLKAYRHHLNPINSTYTFKWNDCLHNSHQHMTVAG